MVVCIAKKAIFKSDDRAIIDGKPYIWIPVFRWIVDEGGGSRGAMFGNSGDELIGNKVDIMGGLKIVDGKLQLFSI